MQPTESSPQWRRITVRADDIAVDLSVPHDMRTRELITALADLTALHHVGRSGVCQLACPQTGLLDPSTTLDQNGIRDGTVLVLTSAPVPAVHVRALDDAEAVLTESESGELDPDRYRGIGPVVAAVGVGGTAWLSVPGTGAPGLLLGGAATAAVAAVSARAIPDQAAVLWSLGVAGAVAATAALPATVFGHSLPSAAVVLTVLALGLLAGAGRLAVVLASTAAARVAAAQVLTTGAALAAAAGPLVCGPGAPLLTALTAVILLARAVALPRGHTGVVLALTGLLCGAVAFTFLAHTGAVAPGWLATVGGMGSAATGWCALRPDLVARLAAVAGTAEKAALLAAVPAAGWALGLFGGPPW